MNLTFRHSLAFLLVASAVALAGCDDSKGSATAATAAPKPAASGAAKTEQKAAPKPEKKAEPAGGKVASCNLIKAESICRQYGDANISAAGEDFLKKMCNGEFKMEACPKDKRVGSCTTQEGIKVFYNEGPLPLKADKAEKACKEGVPAGTFKAGE